MATRFASWGRAPKGPPFCRIISRILDELVRTKRLEMVNTGSYTQLRVDAMNLDEGRTGVEKVGNLNKNKQNGRAKVLCRWCGGWAWVWGGRPPQARHGVIAKQQPIEGPS